MKSLIFVTLLMMGFSTGSMQPPDSRGDDEAALRANVKQLETGWNTKSGAAFARPFAEDADYVVINGMHLKGQTAIEQGHQQIFDTIYKDTTLTLAVQQIRFLRPDVAVVHASGRRNGPGTESYAAVMTLVMTKEKQGWTIAAFQNTAVTSPKGN